jgi:hypothetical protein
MMMKTSISKCLFMAVIAISISTHLSFAFMQVPLQTPTFQQTHNHQHQQNEKEQHQLSKRKISPSTPSKSTTMLQMARNPTIDQWAIAPNGGITGVVKDSPNPRAFRDGEALTTSKILNSRNSLKDGVAVTTESGSKYTLGTKRGSKPKKTVKPAAKSAVATKAATPAVRPRPPSANNNIPTLRNWSISLSGTVTGNVYGGAKSRKGEEIETSRITSNRDSVKEGDVVTTVTGSKYQLGTKKKGLFSSPASAPRPAPAPKPIPAPKVVVPKPTPAPKLTVSKPAPVVLKPTPKPVPAPAPAPAPKVAPTPTPKPNFFNRGNPSSSTTTESSTESIQSTTETTSTTTKRKGTSPFDSLTKKEKPAPFASRGGASSSRKKASTSAATTPAEAGTIPVLDNWSMNRKDEITGIISNSPYPRERDGQTITTKECATDPAFVVEGFTVVTYDGRKYKLGTPTDTANANSTPTLADWDIEDDNRGMVRIVGIMQQTNDPKVPNGQEFTTDEIMTSAEFLDEGFSVVSASGATYKLGRRDRTGVRRKLALQKAAASTTSVSPTSSTSNKRPFQLPSVSAPEIKLPEVSLPEVSLPEVSTPQFKKPSFSFGGSNSDKKKEKEDAAQAAAVEAAVAAETPIKLNRKNSGGSSINAATTAKKQKSRRAMFTRNRVSITLLDEWSMTGVGGVTGIVSNSQDPAIEDGYTLTTSKIITDDIREGQVVETMNGSMYILGTRRVSEVTTPMESPDTPIAAGLWVIAALIFVILERGMY